MMKKNTGSNIELTSQALKSNISLFAGSQKILKPCFKHFNIKDIKISKIGSYKTIETV